MWWAQLLQCTPERERPPASSTEPSLPLVDSGTTWWSPPPPWDHTHDTAPPVATTTGDTSAPVDTGPPPEPAPPCDHQPVDRRITLTGADYADAAGCWLDVADIDADGCAEVLVSECGLGWYYVSWSNLYSAVYVLQEPWVDGSLEDVAYATYDGIGGSDGWGAPAVFLVGAGQMLLGGYDGTQHNVHLHDIPALPEVVPFTAKDGGLFQAVSYGPLNSMADWESPLGPRFLVTTVHAEPGTSDWSGKVRGFEAPLHGELSFGDAVMTLEGDALDRAEMVNADGDLDGDGAPELVVGAYARDLGKGVVAVVSDPPDGDHRLWDVTTSSVLGETEGAELGIFLQVGDLNADGYDDLMAAQLGDGGTAYVFAGPLEGERLASEASWIFDGTQPGEWLGVDAAIGDIDGDGAPDLALGAPPTNAPGQVLVYMAPAEGTHLDTDAPHVLESGLGTAEWFGGQIAGGDIDGDGLYDLVIGAALDSTINYNAGSVQVVFGASW